MLEASSSIQEYNENELKTPQIIIEIEGLSTKYSLVDSKRLARYGDGYTYSGEIYYGKPTLDESILPLISLDGTSTSITQQINTIDASTSIQSITCNIVDLNNTVSELLGQNDVFSKKADVYLSFKDLEHPKDSMRIFSGSINSIEYGATNIKLRIDNPEHLKSQELLVEYKDNLTASMTDSQTTVNVIDTTSLIQATDSMNTYIRVDDEIMLVSSFTDTQILVTRGQLGTTAIAHNANADVSSIYNIYGNPIDIALKVMLSSANGYTNETNIVGFGSYENISEPNAIIVNVYDIKNHIGFVIGDKVKIEGSISNDIESTIVDYGQLDNNMSYVLIDANITEETAQGTISFKSKYDVYPFGCSMAMKEVDVEQHEKIYDDYLLNAPDMSFMLVESIKADEFINKELYKPIGAYPLPRKGQSSAGYTSPPLASGGAVIIDESNILNPFDIVVKRSIKEKFYNNTIYRYGYSVIDEKFLAINQTISADSFNRYDVGVLPLVVESNGMLDNVDTDNFIVSSSRRLLDRYRYGAEYIDVNVNYKTGFFLEAGDTVIFDGRKLNVFDSKTNRRDTFNRIMEITNIKKDIKSGVTTLSLTDTAFKIDGRYATVSPSSIVASGSTSSVLVVTNRATGLKDASKWTNYIGEPIIVRDENFTVSYTATITGVDKYAGIVFISDIGTTPSVGYVIELPQYDNQSNKQKLMHGNISYSLRVFSATSTTNFIVWGYDLGKISVGSKLIIRSADFTRESQIVNVTGIDGQWVYCDDLGFIPQPQDYIEAVSFADSGDAYILI